MCWKKFKPEKEFIVKEEFKFVEIRTEPKPMEEPKVIEQYKTEPKVEKFIMKNLKKKLNQKLKLLIKLLKNTKKKYLQKLLNRYQIMLRKK